MVCPKLVLIQFLVYSGFSSIILIGHSLAWEKIMRLSSPTKGVFYISLVLAVLALLTALGVTIPVISGNALWTALAGYALLAAGSVLKGF
jgi:hypothetical protein